MNNLAVKRSRGNRHKVAKAFISLFVICCLAVLCQVFLLKGGINLDNFTIGRLSVENLSLIWKEKLELQVAKISFAEPLEKSKTESPLSLRFIGKNIKICHLLLQLFSHISIHEIEVKERKGKFEWRPSTARNQYTLTLLSENFDFQSNLTFLQDRLTADLTNVKIKQLNTDVKGVLEFDARQEKITGTIRANIAKHLPVIFDITANSKVITFKKKDAGKVETIKPIVDLFKIDPNVQRWITTYLTGSSYTLEAMAGEIPWNNPTAILGNLSARVRVADCEYIFAPGLKPIKTSYADVAFSNGVMSISPHGSTFSGQPIKEGRVDINFTDPANIVLTAHIKTDAKLNDSILNLLDYYSITLPFKQSEGQTGTDLILNINLSKLNVTSRGEFQLANSEMTWDGKKYDISKAKILLDNNHIEIVSLHMQYEKLFSANITGTIDTDKGLGDLVLSVRKFDLQIGESTLNLSKSASNPTINYHIRPDGHSVDISSSSWNLDGLELTVAPFKSPLLRDQLTLTLPPTPVTIGNDITADLSGTFSIKKLQADLLCNLKKYETKDIVLVKSGGPITIRYDQELTLESSATSLWEINGISTRLYPSTFKYGGQILSIIDSRISYGDFFDSRISGHYNRSNFKGKFLLEHLDVKNRHVGRLIGGSSGVSVEVSNQDNGLTINIPELDLMIRSGNDKNWSATFFDLGTIYPRSSVLQQYKLNNGILTISSKNGKRPYAFVADIPYQYQVLIKDNQPVNELHVSGEITDQGFEAKVNDDIQLRYTDHLDITSDGIGFNVPEIIKLFKKSPSSPESLQSAEIENKKIHISFMATNSNLFFKPENKALADQISLEYDGTRSNIQLLHEQGSISMEIKDNQFTLEGSKLGDTFMGALIQGAEFKQGTMTLAAKGSFDESSALIKIENSTLKNLKPLNNILAFLNTIPALITFSPPEYSTKGLTLKSAVIGLNIEEKIAKIEYFTVQSPVLSLTGTGWINMPQNLIDMDLNLITQAKTNISKIPLLGYILAGKVKRPSITLRLSGNLQNPQVKNTIFKEVVTLPFSLLYHTLTLPLHMVESVLDFAKDQ